MQGDAGLLAGVVGFGGRRPAAAHKNSPSRRSRSASSCHADAMRSASLTTSTTAAAAAVFHLGGTQIVRNDGHFGDYDQPYDTFPLLDRLID
jgi:hypothetical protein